VHNAGAKNTLLKVLLALFLNIRMYGFSDDGILWRSGNMGII
jgi:hypothetical protein